MRRTERFAWENENCQWNTIRLVHNRSQHCSDQITYCVVFFFFFVFFFVANRDFRKVFTAHSVRKRSHFPIFSLHMVACQSSIAGSVRLASIHAARSATAATDGDNWIISHACTLRRRWSRMHCVAVAWCLGSSRVTPAAQYEDDLAGDDTPLGPHRSHHHQTKAPATRDSLVKTNNLETPPPPPPPPPHGSYSRPQRRRRRHRDGKLLRRASSKPEINTTPAYTPSQTTHSHAAYIPPLDHTRRK